MLAQTLAPASTLPRGGRSAVALNTVSVQIAEAIDQTRYSDARIVDAVNSLLARHEIALPGEVTVDHLTDDIMLRIFADEVYDSELNQALRASAATLADVFGAGSTIEVTGWLRGMTVRRNHELFTLTGQACPECEINPECYGTGGGSRCLDTSGCGWGFCY